MKRKRKKPVAIPSAPAPVPVAPEAPHSGLGIHAPVLLAIAVMLPRIVYAQFGLLDDAVTLGNARAALAHPSASLYAYATAGRFLPVYWLYWAFWYALGGDHPAVFYLGNALLLALTVAALIALMRRFNAGPIMTWSASLLFIFSAAAADAYGTLSKGEPAALAAMLGSVWAAGRAARSWRPAPWWMFAGALAVAAMGTRETAIALPVIAAAWLALTFWHRLGKPLLLPRRSLKIYIAVLAAAAAPLLVARLLLRHSLAAGAYAEQYRLTAERLFESERLWGYSLVRNFPELVILLLAAAALAGRRHLRQGQLLWMTAVWMLLTAAILLPWPHADPYYDLAFTAGSSVFCGVMIGELLRLARGTRRGWAAFFRRWTCRAVLAVAIAQGAIVAVNNIGLARAQIHIDDANAGLLDALARLPPHSVVLVNVPASHEYFHEIRYHAQLSLGRGDLRIEPLEFQAPADGPNYVVSLEIARQRWPLIRGPMTENVVALWKRYWENSRGAVKPDRQIARTWQMADLGLEALWCGTGAGPALVCPEPPLRPTIENRQSFYAWNLYSYPRWKDPVRVASFDQGVWTIEQPSGAPLRLALGVPGDVPIAADWDGDGRLEPGVYRPSLNRWFIDRKLSGKPDLVFAVPGMRPDDLPVAGAWGGRGAGPGFYRAKGFAWHLFRSPTGAEELPVIYWGLPPGAVPLAGDWDGDGRATPGFYNPIGGLVALINELSENPMSVGLSLPPGAPVVVNWTGIGVDTINTVHNGKWERRFANCVCEPPNPPVEFTNAPPAGQIFAGRWKIPAR